MQSTSYLEKTSHCRPEDAAQGIGCELTCESPRSCSLLATEQPEPAWCVVVNLYCLSLVAADRTHWNNLATTNDGQQSWGNSNM